MVMTWSFHLSYFYKDNRIDVRASSMSLLPSGAVPFSVTAGNAILSMAGEALRMYGEVLRSHG